MPRAGARVAEPLAEGARAVGVTRFAGGELRDGTDRVACEEPLEIQLGGSPVAVLMRTPGDDLDLVTGFVLTERVVASLDDVASLHHESGGAESSENTVRVLLRPGLPVDLERLRRNLYASSSCGVCGKATLEAALATAPPLRDATRFPVATLLGLPDRLRAAQPVFAETGGLHAAALFDASGALRFVREDVGRHNAVDKVIGAAARAGGLPLAGHGLLVSGRCSFEIVQKALAARLPLVAAVSAPSSLAVALAEAADLAVVGFLRGAGLNVYSARHRVVAAPR